MMRVIAASAALLFLAGAASAATVDQVWSSYQTHWEGVDTLEAEFSQRIEVAGIGGEVISGGRMYFQKPDKLRWNYEQGPPQSVVGDGTWIWIYQPDLEQAYKVDYHTAFGTGGLVRLLAGRDGISDRYDFSLESADPGTVHLRLVPKGGAGETLDLILTDTDFELRRVIVHDPAGSVTYLDFNRVVTNVVLDDGLFRFTAPHGVDVITNPTAQ